MHLIKTNSHNNGVSVYKTDNHYYKTAFCGDGLLTLQRERQGYDWFGTEITSTEDSIIIPEFKGKTFPFYNGISGNEEWIKKLIRFYYEKWREKKYVIHGDLVLCNVIFSNTDDNIYIVDWEHFHYADKRFFGFDVINMLFIHLQYEYRWLTYWGFNWVPFIKEKHFLFVREAIKILKKSPFLTEPFTNSSMYIKKYMDKDKFILGKQKGNVLESLDFLCS